MFLDVYRNKKASNNTGFFIGAVILRFCLRNRGKV